MQFRFCTLSSLSQTRVLETHNKLSVTQTEYLNRLNVKGKEQSLAVRTLLDIMLNDLYPSHNITELSADEKGRPFLTGSKLFLSFTHSEEMVGCVLSEKPVGIDIQKIKSVSMNLKKRVCTKEELSFIEENGDDNFFIIWSLKESYIKATGTAFADAVRFSFVRDGKINCDNALFFAEYGFSDEYAWSILKIK